VVSFKSRPLYFRGKSPRYALDRFGKPRAALDVLEKRKFLTPPNGDSFLILMKVVGPEVLTAAVMKSSIFWDITPHCPLKDYKRAEICLPHSFTLVCCLEYSSTMKMKLTYSSEMSVDFQRTARSYITKTRTLDNGYYKVKTAILGILSYKIFQTASLVTIP
jgi:hypothetical protein